MLACSNRPRRAIATRSGPRSSRARPTGGRRRRRPIPRRIRTILKDGAPVAARIRPAGLRDKVPGDARHLVDVEVLGGRGPVQPRGAHELREVELGAALPAGQGRELRGHGKVRRLLERVEDVPVRGRRRRRRGGPVGDEVGDSGAGRGRRGRAELAEAVGAGGLGDVGR